MITFSRVRKSQSDRVVRVSSERGRRARGFTLIEILVASALTALTFTAGAMLFQAATANGKRGAMLVDLNLGTPLMENFYGLSQNSISAYVAPHSGRGVFAEEMRERFNEDVAGAVAVFCLGRNGMNTVRPTTIPYPATPIRMDTPEAFRLHLVSQFPEAATIFSSYRVVPATTNGTIFIMGPSALPNELLVRAIYEIDLVPHAGPAGTYASVRRYVGTSLTNYYDIFYESGAGALFQPLFVSFEREARAVVTEGEAIDRFKKAKNYPFYFVWWPDPEAMRLEQVATAIYPSSDPREAYGHMGGRTSYMFTVPLFPPH
ncbi:MAG: prepilin-type N-terminal cleavage/methylation domain-containing protein [Verrucomicrobiota bacterium]